MIDLEPPRWLNGPPICEMENLPAFESAKAAKDFHEANAPGCHADSPFLCRFCGRWHYQSTARRKH